MSHFQQKKSVLGGAVLLSLLASAGLVKAQPTITQSYTSIDPYGNRTTTTIEAPASIGGFAGGIQSSAQSYSYGYGYGYGTQSYYEYPDPYGNYYAYPYPYPQYAPQPVYSGPLHPTPPGTLSPWVTSIPLGTVYSYNPPQAPYYPPQYHDHDRDRDRDWGRDRDRDGRGGRGRDYSSQPRNDYNTRIVKPSPNNTTALGSARTGYYHQ